MACFNRPSFQEPLFSEQCIDLWSCHFRFEPTNQFYSLLHQNFQIFWIPELSHIAWWLKNAECLPVTVVRCEQNCHMYIVHRCWSLSVHANARRVRWIVTGIFYLEIQANKIKLCHLVQRFITVASNHYFWNDSILARFERAFRNGQDHKYLSWVHSNI